MRSPEAPTEARRRRRRRPAAFAAVVVAATVLLAVALWVVWAAAMRQNAGDAAPGGPPVGGGQPAPTTAPGEEEPGIGGDDQPGIGGDDEPAPGTEELAAFTEQCEDGVDQWRAGQLDFPARLVVRFPGSATYNAAVDAREAALPPDQVIDVGDGGARSTPVHVQCRVGARLVPVGEHLTVEGEGDDDWVYKEWSPLGVVEWSWTVAASEPVDQELRLDLRPAVVADDISTGADTQLSVTTDVEVRSTVIRQFGHWVQTEWAVLWGSLAVLGGAFLAARAGLRKLRKGDT
jgi:hypothetical protein